MHTREFRCKMRYTARSYKSCDRTNRCKQYHFCTKKSSIFPLHFLFSSRRWFLQKTNTFWPENYPCILGHFLIWRIFVKFPEVQKITTYIQTWADHLVPITCFLALFWESWGPFWPHFGRFLAIFNKMTYTKQRVVKNDQKWLTMQFM